MEVYVDQSTTEQQNVSFTTTSFDVNIQDHPVGSRLPHETETASVQLVSDDFKSVVARPNFPSFYEMERQRLPQISLHVACFRDATIVTFTWPHIMMDVMGGQALLAGWSAVLAGKEDEVPRVMGARDDILRHPEITGDEGVWEEPVLELHRLSAFGLICFSLRFLWDKLWETSRERRVICLPKAALSAFRAHAERELSAGEQEKQFVSESDVVIAWIARAISATEPKPRNVTVVNLLNARFRVPLLLKSTGVFLQNMVLATFTFLSAQAANNSIGSIALDHRRTVAEQGTGPQSLGLLRKIFTVQDAGKTPRTLYGPSNAVPLVINNVLKTNLIKTADFSSAVVSQGEATETRKNPVGTMVNYYNESLHNEYDGYNIFVMLGKDHADNSWLMGTLLPRTWAKIEAELRPLPI